MIKDGEEYQGVRRDEHIDKIAALARRGLVHVTVPDTDGITITEFLAPQRRIASHPSLR